MARRAALLFAVALIAVVALSCATGVGNDDDCGNGTIDPGEQCEGTDFGGATCQTLGRGNGDLSCDAQCQLDTSGCTGGTCGNGILNPGEACDGDNLGGRTCLTEFFTGGTLACGLDCELDTSGCTNEGCGNGQMNQGEMCDDGNNTNGDGCSEGCIIEDGWSCDGVPSVCTRTCGNSTIDPTENCDGVNLNGATCVSLGYDSGSLACSASCTFDTTLCVGSPPCGNGVVEGTEECDGANLNGASCISLGWDSGILSCAGDCTYNTSLCAYQTCGNGTIDTGEDCDGNQLGGEDCVSQGFPAGGVLGCTSGCAFDTSNCVQVTCGNGSVDTGEDCDGSDLNGQDCVSQGYTGGTLNCNGNCTFNFSGCSSTSVCGNGSVEVGEACDDGNTTSGDGCSQMCQWEVDCSADSVMSCNSTVSGSIGLFRFDDDINFMSSCSTNAATGPEDIFSFVATGTGLANVYLEVVQDGWVNDDLDIYVMEGSCHQQLCIDYGDADEDDNVNFNVVTGQVYYLVVELDYWGFPPTGEYNLTLTCPP